MDPPHGCSPNLPTFPADEWISRGKARDFHPIYLSHIRPPDPDDFGLRVPTPPRPSGRRLVCALCSSGQGFAYSFFPTPLRAAAVAVRLGVPVIRAPRGLTPPSHFLVGFRLPVDSAGYQRCAPVPGAHRVGTPGCPGAPLTEPDKCCSHPALRDDGLLPPPPVGSRPRLSQAARAALGRRTWHALLPTELPATAGPAPPRERC